MRGVTFLSDPSVAVLRASARLAGASPVRSSRRGRRRATSLIRSRARTARRWCAPPSPGPHASPAKPSRPGRQDSTASTVRRRLIQQTASAVRLMQGRLRAPTALVFGQRWCDGRESNPQPSDSQSDALPLSYLDGSVLETVHGTRPPNRWTARSAAPSETTTISLASWTARSKKGSRFLGSWFWSWFLASGSWFLVRRQRLPGPERVSRSSSRGLC